MNSAKPHSQAVASSGYWHVTSRMSCRSGALTRVLPDLDCLGGLPIVAIQRKTKPRLSPTNAFVSHRAREFQRYDDLMPVAAR
jgi:hypothetical protein